MSFELLLDGQIHQVEILRRRPLLVVRIAGRDYRIEAAGTADDGCQRLIIDGQPVQIARAADGMTQILRIAGQTRIVTQHEDGGDGTGGGDQSELRAPMPGAVIEVHVASGDRVRAGDPLVTIESMKLQTVLGSPRDGIIAEVAIATGEIFGKDQPLVRLQEEATADA